MPYNPDIHRRASIRMRDFDYASTGAYFVTISAHNKECLFGAVDGEAMAVNELGAIVREEWLKTPNIRPNVSIDEFVVMPNHFHAIVFITENRRGVLQYAPTTTGTNTIHSPSQTIGAIVRGFKGATTKCINILRDTPGVPVWQRNYYERVVRNDRELDSIRRYICNNPLKWADDEENPAVGAS